jgi:hypothetical protein
MRSSTSASAKFSWATPLLAIALTPFFVLVFGPITLSSLGGS